MFKTFGIKIKFMWPLWPAVLGIAVLVALVPANCLAQLSMQQPLISQRRVQFLADQSSLSPTTTRQQELAATNGSKQQHATKSQQRSLAGASNRLQRQQMINYGHLFDDSARSSSRSFELDASGSQAPRRRTSKQRRLKSGARSLGLSAGRKSRARAARLSKARALAATKRVHTRSMRQRRDITTTKATLTTGKRQEEAPELNENSFDEYDSVQGSNKKQKLTANDPTGTQNKKLASKSTARFAGPFDFLLNQQQASSGCNCKCCNNGELSEQRTDADADPELSTGQPQSAKLQSSPSSSGLNSALSSTVSNAKKLQDSELDSSATSDAGPSELKLSGSRERAKPKQLALETAPKAEAEVEQDNDKQLDQDVEQRQGVQGNGDETTESSNVSLSNSQLPNIKLSSDGEKSPVSQSQSSQLDAIKGKLSADSLPENKDKKLEAAAKTPSLVELDENNGEVTGVSTDASHSDEPADKSDEGSRDSSLLLSSDGGNTKKTTERDERPTGVARDDPKEASADSASLSKQRDTDERKLDLPNETNAETNSKVNSPLLATQERPSLEAAQDFARTADVKQKLLVDKPLVKEIEEKVEKKEEAVVEGIAEKEEKKKEIVDKLLEPKKKFKKHPEPEPEPEHEPEPEPEPEVPVYKSKPRPVYKPAKQRYPSASGSSVGQYSPHDSNRIESFPSRCRSNIRELTRIIKELLAVAERLGQKSLADGSVDYATRDVLSRKLTKIRSAGEQSLMAANLGKLRILNDVAKAAGIELIRLGHLKAALRLEPSLKKLGAKLRRFYGLYRKSCKGVSY